MLSNPEKAIRIWWGRFDLRVDFCTIIVSPVCSPVKVLAKAWKCLPGDFIVTIMSSLGGGWDDSIMIARSWIDPVILSVHKSIWITYIQPARRPHKKDASPKPHERWIPKWRLRYRGRGSTCSPLPGCNKAWQRPSWNIPSNHGRAGGGTRLPIAFHFPR